MVLDQQEYKNIKLSIIITVYNKEQYLTFVLKQLLSQLREEVELIIINDCSTDNSKELILNMISSQKNIILYNNEKNLGIGKVRKKALDLIRGEYVCFIDADDFISDNYVNILLKEISNNYDVVIFNGMIFPYGEELLETEWKQIAIWNKVYNINFLKRKKINFKEEDNGEDILFNNLVFKNNPKTLIIKDFLYYYNSTSSPSLTR